MITTKKLLYFNSLELNLSDVLVYLIISSRKGPSTLSGILCCQDLNIKERQLRNILIKLENLNLLTRFRNQYNQYFVLPFVLRTNIKRIFKPQTGNTLPIKSGNKSVVNLIKGSRPATLYHNSYIYNNYIKLRKYNVLKRHNYNNIYDDDIITYNYNINTRNNEHNIVVTKNNYNKIKDIKERFKTDFPTKNAYIAQELPKDFDYSLLKEKINNSDFLKAKDNLGLNWFIKNYDKVVNNFYTNVNNSSHYNNNQTEFSQRTYTKEFLDSLFDIR